MVMGHKKEVDGNYVGAPAALDLNESSDLIDEGDLSEDQEGDLSISLSPMTLSLSRSLLRKISDYAREEGVTREEFASELISEGIVVRAWEIVEKRAAMRGGNANASNNNNNNFNRNGNTAAGNQSAPSASHSQNNQQRFQGGNKMAQRKLQRQTRQHANSMDLMSDKAAFLEYVRNQEKKRR